jgi:hypothetical protein
MDDFDKFKKLMRVACKIFDKPFDEELCGIYYEFLKKYEFIDIKWAFKQYTESNNAFFPKPGQLLILLRQAYDDIAQCNAASEWATIYHNIKQGQYGSEDAIALEAIRRTGGWESVRMMLTENEHFKRRDFIENYIAIAFQKQSAESHQLALGSDKRKASKGLEHDKMSPLQIDNDGGQV